MSTVFFFDEMIKNSLCKVGLKGFKKYLFVTENEYHYYTAFHT